MILVNTPGSWVHIYWPLAHADWHGSTPTDLIFPFFLFIVGAAMAFSFSKHGYELSRTLSITIARRAVILFALGLFLNWFGYWNDIGGLRIMGVLQRIALAYALAAYLVLGLSYSQRFAACVALLLGYWSLLVLFGGADPFGLEHNIVRRFDVAVLGASHLWQGKGIAFDPEGLLSTLPAAVNVVVGFEAARLIRESSQSSANRRLLIGGASMLVISLLWNTLIPINKSLWTSSYVLYSSGISLLLLVSLIWLVDRRAMTWFARSLQIYGYIPIVVYALSWLLTRTTAVLITFPDAAGTSISAYDWFFLELQGPFGAVNASLVFALLHVLLFWLVAWYLYRHRIVIKI